MSRGPVRLVSEMMMRDSEARRDGIKILTTGAHFKSDLSNRYLVVQLNKMMKVVIDISEENTTIIGRRRSRTRSDTGNRGTADESQKVGLY